MPAVVSQNCLSSSRSHRCIFAAVVFQTGNGVALVGRAAAVFILRIAHCFVSLSVRYWKNLEGPAARCDLQHNCRLFLGWGMTS
jgi:hypothetical protein